MNYKELKESDKGGIHEVLFQMDIIGLDDDNVINIHLPSRFWQQCSNGA